VPWNARVGASTASPTWVNASFRSIPVVMLERAHDGGGDPTPVEVPRLCAHDFAVHAALVHESGIDRRVSS
jgi:hypothetical protein